MTRPTDAPSPAKRRIYLLDDHPLVREWLASMVALEPDLELCGQAEDAGDALRDLERLTPDIVVVDLSLPRSSGLEFIKEAKARHPGIRILVLTMHDDPHVAERALRAGANGYVLKRDSGAEIIAGIQAVLQQKFHVSAAVAPGLNARLFGRGESAQGSPAELLSDRELDVFRLRGQGLAMKEIADQLKLSIKTVSSYEARIKEKLNFDSMTALTREAILWAEREKPL